VFAVVQRLQTSSGGCFLCGSQNAPYLVAGITTALVGTAEGPKRIPGEVAFCIGTEDHPGCLDTALNEAGGRGPHARRREDDAVAAKLNEYERQLAELQAALAEALANQQPVVTLEDARALVGEGS